MNYSSFDGYFQKNITAIQIVCRRRITVLSAFVKIIIHMTMPDSSDGECLVRVWRTMLEDPFRQVHQNGYCDMTPHSNVEFKKKICTILSCATFFVFYVYSMS